MCSRPVVMLHRCRHIHQDTITVFSLKIVNVTSYMHVCIQRTSISVKDVTSKEPFYSSILSPCVLTQLGLILVKGALLVSVLENEIATIRRT